SSSPNGTARVWEVASGRERLVFKGHQGRVYSLSFSPDGRTLASGSEDGSVLLWDVGPPSLRSIGAKNRVGAKDLERWWSELANNKDPGRAYQAIRALAAAKEHSPAFLKNQRPPTSNSEHARIKELIVQLDSRRYAVRREASWELEQYGSE